MFSLLIGLSAVFSLASAAAFRPARQVVSSLSESTASCPVTIVSYVTVTEAPPTVTIAVPDYSSISKSLASASTIDSIVVVEQSQDAPAGAGPPTSVPTFHHTILAPAYEATEAAGASGSSVYYVSVGPNTTDWSYTPSASIVVGVTTVTVLPWQATTGTSVMASETIHSTIRVTTTLRASFSILSNGWNGTSLNATHPSHASGSVVSTSRLLGTAGFDSTTTVTTFITTVTTEAATTVFSDPSAIPTFNFGYGASTDTWVSPDNLLGKRQTCNLIWGDVGGGQTATWCNNFYGTTTLTYTSWETTVLPKVSTTEASQSLLTPSQSSNSSISSASASVSPIVGPSPSSCGQTGPFNISFDDLPEQSVFPNQTAGLPPIFNPFDHFYWAAGWSYAPPPVEAYVPYDGDQFAIYNVTLDDENSSSSGSALMGAGSFGAGPRSYLDQYWFNATSAMIGCEANVVPASGQCEFVAKGWQYDVESQQQRLIITQYFYQPLCQQAPCEWHKIGFNKGFNALSTISFYASIDGRMRDFYVDDIQLGWWNSTCEAGLMRIGSRK